MSLLKNQELKQASKPTSQPTNRYSRRSQYYIRVRQNQDETEPLINTSRDRLKTETFETETKSLWNGCKSKLTGFTTTILLQTKFDRGRLLPQNVITRWFRLDYLCSILSIRLGRAGSRRVPSHRFDSRAMTVRAQNKTRNPAIPDQLRPNTCFHIV